MAKREPKSFHTEDLLLAVEDELKGVDDAGTVELPAYVVRWLIRRVRAKKPGAPSKRVSARNRDIETVRLAKARKQQLQAKAKAQGVSLTAPDAARQAAEQVKRERQSPLSVRDITERMIGRPKRARLTAGLTAHPDAWKR